MNVRLYFNTLRYLKFEQILFRFIKILFPSSSFKMTTFTGSVNCYCSTSNFPVFNRYLGQNIYINGNEVDLTNLASWNNFSKSTLDLYIINYFDFLFYRDNIQDKDFLINILYSWSKNMNLIPISHDPYPLSIRISNWTKFFIKHEINDQLLLNSLFSQLNFLSKNIEYHVGGNHLIANAKALILAGLFLRQDKFVLLGRELLEREISIQFSEQGTHKEASPMYHLHMLEDILDIANFDDTFRYRYKDFIRSVFGYYLHILTPDLSVPRFNDSIDHVYKDFSSLSTYFHEVMIDLEDSNHFLYDEYLKRISGSNYFVLFDIGPMGLDHVPGHVHSDALSFELYYKQQKVISNPGISTYNICSSRDKERRTSSHNTVQIGNLEQYETWSSFRVARRGHTKVLQNEENLAHAQFSYFQNGVSHKRKISLEDNSIIICDKIEIKYELEILIHFHLTPNFNILNVASDSVILSNLIFSFSAEDFEILIEDYDYCISLNSTKKSSKFMLRLGKNCRSLKTIIKAR